MATLSRHHVLLFGRRLAMWAGELNGRRPPEPPPEDERDREIARLQANVASLRAKLAAERKRNDQLVAKCALLEPDRAAIRVTNRGD